jgi:hypothetical protein
MSQAKALSCRRTGEPRSAESVHERLPITRGAGSVDGPAQPWLADDQ